MDTSTPLTSDFGKVDRQRFYLGSQREDTPPEKKKKILQKYKFEIILLPLMTKIHTLQSSRALFITVYCCISFTLFQRFRTVKMIFHDPFTNNILPFSFDTLIWNLIYPNW